MNIVRRYQLGRLQYLIRKRIEDEFLTQHPGLLLDVVAEEVASGFSYVLRARILGQQRSRTIEIDSPDGRWQALRYVLGLGYRRRRIEVTATSLFPYLPTTADAVTYLEWDNASNP